MRIIFVGTSELGIPSLKALKEQGKHQVFVVSKPDQTGGRGNRVFPSPIKKAALALGYDCHTPENINSQEMLDWVKETKSRIIIVASFWAKLSKQLLESVEFGGVNIHPSLLPKYRGAAPIQHALLNGDPVTGVTLFQMAGRMDAGPILAQTQEPVLLEDNNLTLHDRLAEKAAPLLLNLLQGFEEGAVKPREQDDSQMTLAPKFNKNHGRIQWAQPAENIERQIRAMTPWPGAFTFYVRGRKRIRLSILKAKAFAAQNPVEPGRAVLTEKRLKIACKDSELEILRLQREGKKEMSAEEFLRGAPMEAGAVFSSEP